MVTKVAAAYTANYTNRIYWTRMPTGYDGMHPYNLILWGQGCGQGPSPESIPPYENPQASAASIIVELLASQKQPNHCYSAGPDGDAADSPEIPYFDQVVSEVEAQFCIDTTKVFEGGYSSGGWESSLMSCVRTNVLRGTGWVAAGLQNNHDECMGPVAALITRAAMDNGTPADRTMAALESIRMRNGCATTTKPWLPTVRRWRGEKPDILHVRHLRRLHDGLSVGVVPDPGRTHEHRRHERHAPHARRSLEALVDAAVARDGRPPPPFPESLCHRCAGRRYVPARASTFVMCTVLEVKYPRQPVLACPAFRVGDERDQPDDDA